MGKRMIIMAGGTGGHVFPALAVGEELRRRGREILWLGTPDSFESRLVPEHGFEMELVRIRGLRGKGILRWLAAPFSLGIAIWQALRVLQRYRPRLVLGMGGFVTGPGGVAARLLGIPLVIHEQNAIPGMTNRYLSRIASRVLEAFPRSFPGDRRAVVTGNPVRPDICTLPVAEQRLGGRLGGPLHLLVLGGSQGARALNEVLPAAVAMIDEPVRPAIRHQAGKGKDQATADAYRDAGVGAEVSPFVGDMAEAYAWADLVICRAGAITVAELAAAGVGAILVPYPYAVDDHQASNAKYLADAGAARLIRESALTPGLVAGILEEFADDRRRLVEMAVKAHSLALPDATRQVADACDEVAAR